MGVQPQVGESQVGRGRSQAQGGWVTLVTSNPPGHKKMSVSR